MQCSWIGRQMAEDAILHNQLIAVILDPNNKLYIAYRPVGYANTTQSSNDMMEIQCDDTGGFDDTKPLLGMSNSHYKQQNVF